MLIVFVYSDRCHFIFFVKNIMETVLIVLLIVSGLVLTGSVMLMSPKGGGLGAGITGVAAGGNYGSTRNVESRLKRIALISAVVFLVVSIALPYNV